MANAEVFHRRLSLTNTEVSRISRIKLLSYHEPFQIHLFWHMDEFYSYKSAKYPIPESCSNAMIHFWIMKVMIKMMLTQQNEWR